MYCLPNLETGYSRVPEGHIRTLFRDIISQNYILGTCQHYYFQMHCSLSKFNSTITVSNKVLKNLYWTPLNLLIWQYHTSSVHKYYWVFFTFLNLNFWICQDALKKPLCRDHLQSEIMSKFIFRLDIFPEHYFGENRVNGKSIQQLFPCRKLS